MDQFESNLMQANEKVNVVDPSPPKECMQIGSQRIHRQLTCSLALNRSTANRLQRYKTISRSIQIFTSRHSLILLSSMYVIYGYIFFSLYQIPRDFILLYSTAKRTADDTFGINIHTQLFEYNSNANHGNTHNFSVWLPIKAIGFQNEKQTKQSWRTNHKIMSSIMHINAT